MGAQSRWGFIQKKELGHLEQEIYMGKISKAEGPRFPQTLEQRTFPGAKDQWGGCFHICTARYPREI